MASAVARRAREGALTTDQCDRVLAGLNHDLRAMAVVELIPEISEEARSLLRMHALRAGDAIQLASALHLQRHLGRPTPFVVFDERLAAAARAAGLGVLGTSTRSAARPGRRRTARPSQP